MDCQPRRSTQEERTYTILKAASFCYTEHAPIRLRKSSQCIGLSHERDLVGSSGRSSQHVHSRPDHGSGLYAGRDGLK
jgi:hypothetical protein